MADSWDADDFEPPPLPVVKNDDEDKVKESWEDEEAATKPEAPTQTKAVKKKTKFKKLDMNGAAPEPEPGRQLTEKEREDFQRQAEYHMMIESFGGADSADSSPLSIKLDSREEFEQSAKDVAQRLTSLKKSSLYVPFLEELFRQLCLNLETEHAKQLSKTVSFTAQELQKRDREAEQAAKKKAKSKPTLKKASDDPFDFDGSMGGAQVVDDDDDFM